MANDTVVRAPYNFVPFSGKILEYKQAVSEHDAVDPGLKTGEIHVSMTADTPVFVSDGNREKPHFFRGPDGQYMLPGSTIRGMVRQNMQILGFGLVRTGEDLEDKRLFYRRLADKNDTVFGELKRYYWKLLNVKQEWRNGKPYATPRGVKAGYLHKVGDSYQIWPVQGTFLRVSRNHPDVKGLDNKPSQALDVSYTAVGKRVEKIRKGSVRGMMHGKLLYTGKPVGKKLNPLYLFPEEDKNAQPVILEEDALLNATDQELRANFLRLRYLNSIAEDLPQSHREKQEDPDFLDWPRAILGWAGKDSSRRSRVSFSDFPAKAVDADKKNAASTLRPLPAGTVFSGVIRYRNLRPEELGLLLWALRLEEGCYQSVGMGKPYGYGRMKLSIDSLREYDMAALYRSDGLCARPEPSPEEIIQQYIDAFDGTASQEIRNANEAAEDMTSVKELSEIRDFFYLRRTICRGREVSYMSLKEYQNAGHPLPDVASFRQEAEKMEQAEAPVREDDSFEAMKAKLAQKFNSR